MPLSKICGSSRFTIQIANELVTRGHRVTVIANKENSGKSKYKFHLTDVDTPPYGSWQNCLNDETSFFKSINKYLTTTIHAHKQFNFDILHVQHLLFSTLIAHLFKQVSNVPFIATCHGTETYESKGIPKMERFFSYAKDASRITMASESIAQDIKDFIKIPRKDLIITSPAVNTSSFFPNCQRRNNVRRVLGINNKDFVILFAGRLVKEKGILEVPDIFKSFLRDHPNSILLIVGDGPERVKLEVKLASLDLPKSSYKITGFVSQEEMPGYYNSADVLIMPSLWNEPFATVSLEAMASGCIVLVRDIGGIALMLKRKGFNKLVCRINKNLDFYKKMDRLYQNEDERGLIAQQLVNLVKNEYTWQHRTDNLLKIYEKVIKNERKS